MNRLHPHEWPVKRLGWSVSAEPPSPPPPHDWYDDEPPSQMWYKEAKKAWALVESLVLHAVDRTHDDRVNCLRLVAGQEECSLADNRPVCAVCRAEAWVRLNNLGGLPRIAGIMRALLRPIHDYTELSDQLRQQLNEAMKMYDDFVAGRA